jgi:ferredoxin
MIPREGREPTTRANPKLCVSCGICKQKFQPSIVNEERCQNCQQCFMDCPQCSYREGTNWLEEMLFKDREPFLRKDKVNPNKIKIFLNDSNNPDQWNYNFEENLNLKNGKQE